MTLVVYDEQKAGDCLWRNDDMVDINGQGKNEEERLLITSVPNDATIVRGSNCVLVCQI